MKRRALVIGGRRGIGAAVVQALAAQGLDVTYTYRTAFADAAATSRQLDLADRAAVDAFAREQEDAAGLGRRGACRAAPPTTRSPP